MGGDPVIPRGALLRTLLGIPGLALLHMHCPVPNDPPPAHLPAAPRKTWPNAPTKARAPRTPRTESDRRAIERAERKRAKRAAKNRA